jgi:hypothetical protein
MAMPDHKAFALALMGLLRRHEAEWPSEAVSAMDHLREMLRDGDISELWMTSLHITASRHPALRSAHHAANAVAAITPEEEADKIRRAVRWARVVLPEAEHPAVDALVAMYLTSVN